MPALDQRFTGRVSANRLPILHFGVDKATFGQASQFKTDLGQAYLSDFRRLGRAGQAVLQRLHADDEEQFLSHALSDEFHVEELRIMETAGLPLYPSYEESKQELLHALDIDEQSPGAVATLQHHQLDTEENWRQWLQDTVDQYIEAPCRELVKNLLDEGMYPVSSNAYRSGPKGVYYREPGASRKAKDWKFRPLSDTPSLKRQTKTT